MRLNCAKGSSASATVNSRKSPSRLSDPEMDGKASVIPTRKSLGEVYVDRLGLRVRCVFVKRPTLLFAVSHES